MKSLHLKSGRDQTVRQRHPWIFSGAVERIEGKGQPEPGETVMVRASDGAQLGLAAYSPHSSIRARMWTWNADEAIGVDFFRVRVAEAVRLRRMMVPAGESNAMRLVHGESDELPGVVADLYGDVIVLQCLTAGAEAWRDVIADVILEASGASALFERSDSDVRALEGLPVRVGCLRGEMPAERITILENGLRFFVDVRKGQKTGFYLDQRRNRQRVGQLTAGRRVLNCFCYSGAFSVYALAGGASEVLSVDSAPEALALGVENVGLNGLPAGQARWQEGDVFEILRGLRDRSQRFDAIVLDPPKFAPTRSQVHRAARGYKDINLLAFKLLNPGGLLFTFSCSGGVSEDLFQKIVAGAALDAGVSARIVERLSQAPDHPVGLNFPEGAYLKGLICEVTR